MRKTQNSKIWIFGSCESPSKINSATKVWFPSPIVVYSYLPAIRKRTDVFLMFDFTCFINKYRVNNCTLLRYWLSAAFYSVPVSSRMHTTVSTILYSF